MTSQDRARDRGPTGSPLPQAPGTCPTDKAPHRPARGPTDLRTLLVLDTRHADPQKPGRGWWPHGRLLEEWPTRLALDFLEYHQKKAAAPRKLGKRRSLKQRWAGLFPLSRDVTTWTETCRVTQTDSCVMQIPVGTTEPLEPPTASRSPQMPRVHLPLSSAGGEPELGLSLALFSRPSCGDRCPRPEGPAHGSYLSEEHSKSI